MAPRLSRRGLFALGAAGLLLPRRLFAASGSDRKFLFVFNPGGWDPTMVFAPLFGPGVDHFGLDEPARIGDFDLVDSPTRPSVRSFFERWGARTCVIDGLQVPSVAHDVCTLLTMTGSSRGNTDDWVSILAGNSPVERLMPNVHVSGPIYPHEYTAATVRIGANGQLRSLVTGEAVARSTIPVQGPSSAVEALEEAAVRANLERFRAGAAAGSPARVAELEEIALDRAAQLPSHVDALDISDTSSLYQGASAIVRVMAAGLARTGMVAYGAGGNGAWDTHSGNDAQDVYYQTLFDALDRILADLTAAPGEAGGTLLDETTIVVLSEMGRTPKLNPSGGKDHWTWTSAMLIGSGIAGGRKIGAWNDDLTGSPVDLASGEAHDSGEVVLPGHIGATLLALADLDPDELMDPSLGSVIEGILAT